MNASADIRVNFEPSFAVSSTELSMLGAGAVAAVGTIAMTALGFGALGPIITMAQ